MSIKSKRAVAAPTPPVVTPDNQLKHLSIPEVDGVVMKLLDVGNSPLSESLDAVTLRRLCVTVLAIFKEQESLIEIDGPVNVCGDLHGQYADLLRLYDRIGFPPLANYLFLGDYVDRGPNSLEVICLNFCYKIKYPLNYFLLRGNHETRSVNTQYGFAEECEKRFGPTLYPTFCEAFNWMPLVALVGERILCMHGGVGPKFDNMDVLRNYTRPSDPEEECVAVDLMWADPEPGVIGFIPNERGASWCFGEEALADIMAKLDIDLVCRAHQVVQDGYEFFAARKLVTVFSAPHYCAQFCNSAAVMQISEDLQCSFIILRPNVKSGPPILNMSVPTFSHDRERAIKPTEDIFQTYTDTDVEGKKETRNPLTDSKK